MEAQCMKAQWKCAPSRVETSESSMRSIVKHHETWIRWASTYSYTSTSYYSSSVFSGVYLLIHLFIYSCICVFIAHLWRNLIVKRANYVYAKVHRSLGSWAVLVLFLLTIGLCNLITFLWTVVHYSFSWWDSWSKSVPLFNQSSKARVFIVVYELTFMSRKLYNYTLNSTSYNALFTVRVTVALRWIYFFCNLWRSSCGKFLSLLAYPQFRVS